jgi:hypothetical protein
LTLPFPANWQADQGFITNVLLVLTPILTDFPHEWGSVIQEAGMVLKAGALKTGLSILCIIEIRTREFEKECY